MINDYFNIGDVLKFSSTNSNGSDIIDRKVISSISEVKGDELFYRMQSDRAIQYINDSSHKYYKLNLITNLFQDSKVLDFISPIVILDSSDSMVSMGVNVGLIHILHAIDLDSLVNETTNVDYIKFLNK